MQRGAAFFDLDRTLMAGSSGMHFARAAYGSGMVGRRQLMRWGVEHVHFRLRGSTDEQTSGLLTGRIVEPFVYGEGKVAKMRDFAEEHDIDLAASWAYSDSVSDLPMLRAVGHPVAVNPDTELAEIAVEEGWRVMRFERLGRQLAIAGATLVAAAVGGTGTVLARRRPERRGYRATLRR